MAQRDWLVRGLELLVVDEIKKSWTGAITMTKFCEHDDPREKDITLTEHKDGRMQLVWPKAVAYNEDIDFKIFENQRHQPGAGGWGNTYPGHLLPTDCAAFTDETRCVWLCRCYRCSCSCPSTHPRFVS